MFWSMKRLLMNKNLSIHRRFRLFESTVCKCVLWCCESWTPRAEEARALKVARNRMLRRIVAAGRAPEEQWVDWIRRTTRRANDTANRAGVAEWERAHYWKKWGWAGHVARMPDAAWAARVTDWRSSQWQERTDALGLCRPQRPSTRRWMKWEDAMRRYCNVLALGPWTDMAQSREVWSKHAAAFSKCW